VRLLSRAYRVISKHLGDSRFSKPAVSAAAATAAPFTRAGSHGRPNASDSFHIEAIARGLDRA
jgi:hypothetical protein